jgi:hypothetical protein
VADVRRAYDGYINSEMREIAFTGNDNFIVGCEISFCLSGA